MTTPILALGGDRGSAPDIYEAIKPLGEIVEGGVIRECGHYIPEEQPAELAARMTAFFRDDGRRRTRRIAAAGVQQQKRRLDR